MAVGGDIPHGILLAVFRQQASHKLPGCVLVGTALADGVAVVQLHVAADAFRSRPADIGGLAAEVRVAPEEGIKAVERSLHQHLAALSDQLLRALGPVVVLPVEGGGEL